MVPIFGALGVCTVPVRRGRSGAGPPVSVTLMKNRRSVNLSITHNFRSDRCAQFDVGDPAVAALFSLPSEDTPQGFEELPFEVLSDAFGKTLAAILDDA